MNLTLHHFLKEFRYLRVRWCVLLAVLLLDLALNMEWVLPMRPLEAGATTGAYIASDIVMRVLLWMVVWWFMLSVPSEEDTSGGRGYALTRPLPRTSYWAARLLVWVVLVLVPLMLESALYLNLNGRPFSEVMLGMAERAWADGSMTLWLLPLPLLLRGWERYVAIVLVVIALGSPLQRLVVPLSSMLSLDYDPPNMALEFGRSVQATWLVGLLVPVVVMWQKRSSFGVLARLGVVLVLALLQHGAASSPLFADESEKAHDPELIRRLTAGREVVISGLGRHFRQEQETGDASDVVLWRGEKYIGFSARAQLAGMPEEYVASWRATAKTMVQNGEVMPSPPDETAGSSPFYAAGGQCLYGPMARALPGAKPPGLLTMDVSGELANMQIRLPQPKRPDEAVSVQCDLTAEWMRAQRLGEVPLREGARFASPDFEIEILKVRPNVDGQGERAEGFVTFVYRLSARSFDRENDLLPWFPQPFMVSDAKRFMWQYINYSGYEQMRGGNLGWCHAVLQCSFQQVLEPGTGVTAENLGEQRLVWMKPEYLGSSQHKMEMKDLKIGETLMQESGWPSVQPAVMTGNPREAFLQQVRGLRRPAEDAGREEIARYVAAVYEASALFMNRIEGNNEGGKKWPGNDQEVCLLLVPFLVKYPELFRAALPHDHPDLTQGVVHEALLQAGVPGVMRNVKTGGAGYAREGAVPGKPGEKKKRVMETLWLPSWGRPSDFEAYVEAIRQKSDEPLWPLMEDKPRSTDEVLEAYPRMFDPSDLRWLMKRPDPKYREKAEKVTREAFAQLPAVVKLNSEQEQPLRAAVALGMPEALDWMLRGLALKQGDHVRSASVMMGYVAMFGLTETGMPDAKTLRQFLQDVRLHGAKDYRYEAVKMTWELLPDRP